MRIRYSRYTHNTEKPDSMYQERARKMDIFLVTHIRRCLLLALFIISSIFSSDVCLAQNRPPLQQGSQEYAGDPSSGSSLVHLSLNPQRSNAEVNANGPLLWGKALCKNLGGEALQEAQALKHISFKLPVQKFTLSDMPSEQISIITEIVRTVPPVMMELHSTQIRHLKLQDYLLNGTASFQGKKENFSIPVIIRRLSTNRFTVEGKIDASDVFSKSNNFMFANMQGIAKVLLLYEKKQ